MRINKILGLIVLSILVLSTAFLVFSVDGDNLNGIEELRYGTDPLDADTDGDGLTDSEEIQIRQSIPEADLDPLQKDIILEIDYYKDNKPSGNATDIINETFSNAPVENPDGTTGINTHIIVDDSFDGNGSVDFDEYKSNHYQNMHDYKGNGVYHILVVDHAVPSRIGVLGITDSDMDGILVDDFGLEEKLAYTIIHELGHQMGLSSSDYKGIDSRDVEYSSYPSAMNYNTDNDRGHYNFSSGEGFDDWTHISKSLSEGSSASTRNVTSD